MDWYWYVAVFFASFFVVNIVAYSVGMNKMDEDDNRIGALQLLQGYFVIGLLTVIAVFLFVEMK